MPVDKASLLAAIAQGGTAAGEAYKQAQAALEAQRKEAVRMSVRNALAESAPAEFRAQLESRISAPYQTRTADLTSQGATSADFFSKLGATSGAYMDQVEALHPALKERYEYELALKQWDLANRGSGGGGGGGGGSEDDLFGDLRSSLGGTENTKDYISGLAAQQRNPYAAREIALQLGVPEGLAINWFPFGSYEEEGEAVLREARNEGIGARQVRNTLKQIARNVKGNQSGPRKRLVKKYKKAARKK